MNVKKFILCASGFIFFSSVHTMQQEVSERPAVSPNQLRFQGLLETYKAADRPDPAQLLGTVYTGMCYLKQNLSVWHTALLVKAGEFHQHRGRPTYYTVYVPLGGNPYVVTAEEIENSPTARYYSILGNSALDILPSTTPDGSPTLPGKLKVFDSDGVQFPILMFGGDEENAAMVCLYARPAERGPSSFPLFLRDSKLL